MRDIFIPYAGKEPASVFINGHKLLILSTNKQEIEGSLELVGADRIEQLSGLSSSQEQEQEIAKLAESIHGGVVLAPEELHVNELIKNLETELPWVH